MVKDGPKKKSKETSRSASRTSFVTDESMKDFKSPFKPMDSTP
jgi:hypothetical protein